MDGRGRALDNVFIERLWRSLKYELIYPGDFADGRQLFAALERVGSQIFVTGADPATFVELGNRARLYEVTPGRARPWADP